MKTPEQIRKEYSIKEGYKSFSDLLEFDSEPDYHLDQIQHLYADELCTQVNLGGAILSIRDKSGKVFKIGDLVKFSERFDAFEIQAIFINALQRRIELHGNGLFCTLNESDTKVIRKLTRPV